MMMYINKKWLEERRISYEDVLSAGEAVYCCSVNCESGTAGFFSNSYLI